MPFRIDTLRDEFVQVRAGIQRIGERAEAEARDLTEAEVEQEAQLYARAQQLTEELEPLAERQRSLQATESILAGLGVAHRQAAVHQQAGPDLSSVSPGEYAASYIRAMLPGNPNRGADLQAHMDRFRTVATQTTADNAGLLPTPILGPLISFMDANRYVVPTFQQRPMPTAGTTFTRPRITQHVAIAEQTAELQELTSQKLTTAGSNVSKRTFGGSLQLSQQDLDWTDPSVLDLLFQDFADVYTKTTDAMAASSLTAAVTSTVAWTATSVGTILTSIANAASSVYTAASVMPTDMWVDLATGLTLGTLTTTTGDLVFPTIGTGRLDVSEGAKDLGIGLPLGLRLHVCPNLAAGTRIIGAARYAEWYEQRNGFLQVTFPSALKIELAYYGYVATYFQAAGFVKLT
jgi:HK97 family phage major capsid protein